MSISRRTFVAATAAMSMTPRTIEAAPRAKSLTQVGDRFDPWIEIDPGALRDNVRTVARLAGGRPILAVVKNNAYGLGVSTVCPILERLPEIAGFAVVKEEAALEVRQAGIRKPILHMGMFSQAAGPDLVRNGIELSFYTEDARDRVAPLAQAAGGPVRGHAYLDTGMGRMGMPYRQAGPWLRDLVADPAVDLAGTFMAFTEEQDFDRVQLERFNTLAAESPAAGADLGRLHAASSNGVYHLPEAHLDMVRPGIALYGAYPSRPDEERQKAPLRIAFRLRARVVRVAQLQQGDGVSYGRNYVAERPTWVATLPVGHTDGFTRRAVNGAHVSIGGRLYPVIGAVSASHCIVEVGDSPDVSVGDVATLVGPDDEAITPNALAQSVGTSVYDILMHMNPGLPRFVIS